MRLEEIAPYLPYRVKVLRPNKNISLEIVGITKEYILFNENGVETYGDFTHCKPILHPLSDLTNDEFNFIYENETDSESIEELVHMDSESFRCNKFSYIFWEALFKNHFDVFGLIEKGEAVDISTIQP